MDLITRLYACSLKSFTLSQLAYDCLKDTWLAIDSIKLEVVYQMPVCDTYSTKVSRYKKMEMLRNIDPVNSALRLARKISAV